MDRRAWSRLALRRASRRQHAEIPPPQPVAEDVPLPPLQTPDDDREFATWPVPAKPETRVALT